MNSVPTHPSRMAVDESSYQRIVVIGDIHGCIHALDALLDLVQPTANDLVVSLGDFIDYGRETRQVIDRLIELRESTNLMLVMGNHEELLLAALAGVKPMIKESWINCGGAATLNSYRFGGDLDAIPDSHIELIHQCVAYVETDKHSLVHASYEPDLPLDQQPEHVLRWTLIDDQPPAPHYSGKTAIVGHTEQHDGEVLDLGYLKCIDTYCRGCGWLTALDIKSEQFWQTSRWGVVRDNESNDGLVRAKELLAASSLIAR